MKTFLVKFKVPKQVSPDNFEMISMERMFPLETRLSEVNEWVVKNGGCYNVSGYKIMKEVYLSEPE